VFNSIADFKAAALAYKANPSIAASTVPIARFNYRYTLVPDGKLPWQTFQNQFYTVYGQDEWKMTKNFRMTYGARLDYLNIINTASDYANPYVAGLNFREPSGLPYSINTGSMPKSRFYVSPRVGFNWDVNGNKKNMPTKQQTEYKREFACFMLV
jgi:outer membrane receptor protein involved in Fe transport